MKKIICGLFISIFFGTTVITAIGLAYAQERSSSKVLIYYFHGSTRCTSCYRFETYSKELIKDYFKDALESGKLEFKVINVEDRGNQHYADYYQLYTKTIVLSLEKNGREVKWKNLNKIWEYVNDKPGFFDYVKGEINAYLKEV
jgi:hypothetical protein